MNRLRTTILLLAGFGVFFGGSVLLQHGLLRRLTSQPERFYDWLYVPSSDYVKLTTLGYDQFAADFLWLRSIQTFGATFANEQHVNQLDNYFEVITDLDPKFEAVYSFANMVIGEEAGRHDRGLEFLRKGITANPKRYRLPYEAAFFSYWVMDQPELAKYFVGRAMDAPDCPDYVSGWASHFDMKMGRHSAAYEGYFREYANFHNRGIPEMIQVRRATLVRVIMDWHLTVLREKAVAWREKHGANPTVAELEHAGEFLDETMPDSTALMDFISTALARGERLPEDWQEQRDLSEIFLRRGWSRMPTNPTSSNPHFPGYLVWKGQEPLYTPRGGIEPEPNKYFVLGELQAAHHLRLILLAAQTASPDYEAQHDGACPPTIDELNSPEIDRFLTQFEEPWGGEWVWDADLCEFYPSSRPKLLEEYFMAPLMY